MSTKRCETSEIAKLIMHSIFHICVFKPRHEVCNNVAFLYEYTQTSSCSLLLSLETPNVGRSVALLLRNIQATSKGSDQTACMRRLV